MSALNNIIIPKRAVAVFCVMVACPCGANVMVTGENLRSDVKCPGCNVYYGVDVLKRLRKAAELNVYKGNSL